MTTVETPIVLSNDEENPLALSVSHVAKSFRLPTEQASGLKQAFLNWTTGIKDTENRKCCAIFLSKYEKVISLVSSDETALENQPSSRLFQVSIHPKKATL